MKKIIVYIIAIISGFIQVALLFCGVLYLESQKAIDLGFVLKREWSGILIMFSFIWPYLAFLAGSDTYRSCFKQMERIKKARRQNKDFDKLYLDLIEKRQ